MAMQNGKDFIFLVQATDAQLGTDGLVIANQTDGSHSRSRELSDEQTKFGRVLGYGNLSETMELTAYGETGDAGQAVTINAILQGKQVKVWKVNTILNANGKHDADFAYCLVETQEESYPTEGFVEITSTYQVIGQSVKGELEPLPLEVIDFGKYAFEAPGEKTGEYSSGVEVTEPTEPQA